MVLNVRAPVFSPRIVSYDWGHYFFGETIRRILGVQDLTGLRGEDYGVAGLVDRVHDQCSDLHKRFYEGFFQLEPFYYRFAEQMAAELFCGEKVYYQRVPTFRVQFPGNVAVGEVHTDAAYGHQDGVLNVWVPVTAAFGSNTIWVERALGAVLRPCVLGPGEALVFDGVNWRHGNRRNLTGVSRVSFDFRLIPASKYRETDVWSVNARRRLVVGDYYGEFT